MKKVPEVVKEPIFLKFVEHYAKKFKERGNVNVRLFY